MGLREYVIPGVGRDITVRLSEDDAKRLGDLAVAKDAKADVKEAAKPANKARTARDK